MNRRSFLHVLAAIPFVATLFPPPLESVPVTSLPDEPPQMSVHSTHVPDAPTGSMWFKGDRIFINTGTSAAPRWEHV